MNKEIIIRDFLTASQRPILNSTICHFSPRLFNSTATRYNPAYIVITPFSIKISLSPRRNRRRADTEKTKLSLYPRRYRYQREMAKNISGGEQALLCDSWGIETVRKLYPVPLRRIPCQFRGWDSLLFENVEFEYCFRGSRAIYAFYNRIYGVYNVIYEIIQFRKRKIRNWNNMKLYFEYSLSKFSELWNMAKNFNKL